VRRSSRMKRGSTVRLRARRGPASSSARGRRGRRRGRSR
jgi:hypothetical protein